MRRFLLSACIAALACGGSTDDSNSTPKHGAITIRFVNPTSADVYVDETFGRPHQIHDGATLLSAPHDCTPTCEASCDCYVCGAPQSVVRRIAPGAALEVAWKGEYYVLLELCSDGQCSCDQERIASAGSYQVTLAGARGRTPAGTPPQGGDPDLFVGDLDPSQGTCTATGDLVLDGQAKTVDVPFGCTN